MERHDLVGKRALLIYSEGQKQMQCFGLVLNVDNYFLKIKTEDNILYIPNQCIQKVKLRSEEERGGAFESQ